MTRGMLALNVAATISSLIWLIGHSTVRTFDRQFWFAPGYAAR